jgi:hypothetical protein
MTISRKTIYREIHETVAFDAILYRGIFAKRNSSGNPSEPLRRLTEMVFADFLAGMRICRVAGEGNPPNRLLFYIREQQAFFTEAQRLCRQYSLSMFRDSLIERTFL